MEDKTLIFSMKSGTECRMLAILISELQGQGVRFLISNENHLVYLTIK